MMLYEEVVHMKVLVVDNIDSFVYNIVQYIGTLGAEPIVIRNNTSMNKVRKIVSADEIDHFILSPGPKTPKDAGISNDIVIEFPHKKILGVCLGHQCIGFVFGATIRMAKQLKHGKTSIVKHNGKHIFKGLRNPLIAVRYHSLVVDNLPECMEVTANSTDDGEIMGIRHKYYDIFGVQFHPESVLTQDGMRLLKNFLDL